MPQLSASRFPSIEAEWATRATIKDQKRRPLAKTILFGAQNTEALPFYKKPRTYPYSRAFSGILE